VVGPITDIAVQAAGMAATTFVFFSQY